MAYVPIHLSGLGYSFSSPSGAVMNQSVVSANANPTSRWEIDMADGSPLMFRVTSLGYLASATATTKARYLVPTGASTTQQLNTSLTPLAQFLPSPLTMQATPATGVSYISYIGSVAGSPINETYATLVEVLTLDEASTEVGQVTTNNVSAYQRQRVSRSILMPGEKRVLATNLNGILPLGDEIASVRWTMQYNSSAIMSNASISGDRKSCQIYITAQYAGRARIRVDATTVYGDIYTNWQVVEVQAAPWIVGFVPIIGPTTLTAT